MTESDRLQETRRWLRYARKDLVAAETMLGWEGMLPRHVCWLAQQAAEKAIRAVLVFLQIDFPRIHVFLLPMTSAHLAKKELAMPISSEIIVRRSRL